MKQMTREAPPTWAKYGLALLAAAAATLLRLMMDPWVGQDAVPYVTFYAAVALTAFLCGRGPGIVATVSSAIACDFFVNPPRHTILPDASIELVPMGFFVFAGLLVSILAGRLHASRRLAQGRAESLLQRAEELRRERSLQEAIAGATDVMLVYLDPDFNFVSVNEAYARTCKMRPEEMIGKNHFALYPDEENKAIFRQVRDTGVGVFYKDKPFEFPDQPERGVTYWDWSLAPVKDGSSPVSGLVFSLRETTRFKLTEEDLRRNREWLRVTLNSIGDAVIATDTHGQVTFLNPVAAALTGWPANEAAGLPIVSVFALIDERTREPADDIVARVLSERRVVLMGNHTLLIDRDGREVPIEDSAAPITDATGEISGVVLVFHDVAEKRRGQEALRKAHAQVERHAAELETMVEALAAAKISAEQAKATAEAASVAKNHFLAVLSHELRNPLNPVLATASMLRRDQRFDAETCEQLEIICRNAELEARLIDDLLDVTRIERGRIELDRRPIELRTIIHRAVEVCMPDIQARNLEFGVDAGSSAYLVDVDAGRLQQVFWNLIKNAIKFTPAGGCVGIRCRPDGAGFAIAEVNDSGEGIEPEALGSIFNAFEQAERSIARKFGGLGLGLTISKALVEMHGGSISARSEGKGKGATFTVRLPLLQAEAATPSPSTNASPAAAPSRPLRILVVEDHGDSARIMRKLLMADGHEVQTAADVATALKLVGENSFDLMLSDLGLPDGSGLDLIRRIRAKGIDLPGIALSGFGQEADVRQSRDAGFLVHLTKPVSLPRLEEAIAKVVQERTGGSNHQE